MHDARAFVDEPLRDRAADAGTAAGDEIDVVGEPHARSLDQRELARAARPRRELADLHVRAQHRVERVRVLGSERVVGRVQEHGRRLALGDPRGDIARPLLDLRAALREVLVGNAAHDRSRSGRAHDHRQRGLLAANLGEDERVRAMKAARVHDHEVDAALAQQDLEAVIGGPTGEEALVARLDRVVMLGWERVEKGGEARQLRAIEPGR